MLAYYFAALKTILVIVLADIAELRMVRVDSRVRSGHSFLFKDRWVVSSFSKYNSFWGNLTEYGWTGQVWSKYFN